MSKEDDKEYCIWTGDADCYDTSCDNAFYFVEGNCSDNKFTFCPYCGRVIKEENI